MRKPILIESESDTAELLERANEGPVIIEFAGRRYQIQEVEGVTWETYDPEAARLALHNAVGILKGLDIEAFKKEILEQREQDDRF